MSNKGKKQAGVNQWGAWNITQLKSIPLSNKALVYNQSNYNESACFKFMIWHEDLWWAVSKSDSQVCLFYRVVPLVQHAHRSWDVLPITLSNQFSNFRQDVSWDSNACNRREMHPRWNIMKSYEYDLVKVQGWPYISFLVVNNFYEKS